MTLVLAAGCSPQRQAAPVAKALPSATPTLAPDFLINTVMVTNTPVPLATPSLDDGECDTPFYPVKDDASWTYSLDIGSSATHSMSVDDNDAFVITIQGEAAIFTIDGKCTSDGVVLMNTVGAATTMTDGEGSTVVSTVTADGVTVPKDIQTGDHWTQTLTVKVGDHASIIYTEYTALGYEKVTVPNSVFNAMKVEQSGYVEIFGQKVNMHGYQWFAEGVGTVKSAMDGAPAAELVTYDIPD